MSAYLDDFINEFDFGDDLVFQEEDLIDKMIESFTKENERPTAPKQKSHGRGRPRKYFTKKVTMCELEASGWLVKASRGRPKKGEVRVEMEVPFDLEVAPERFYTCENGVLTEVWTSHEQR